MISVSSLGIGPCAPPTTQAVRKLVTPRPQNAIFYPSSFQSLAHSFENENFTTRLLSEGSALFVQNTGGRYLSHDLPLVFKDLRTLAPNGEREGVARLASKSLFEASSLRGRSGLCERLYHKSLLCAPRALCGKFMFSVAFPCYLLPSMSCWSTVVQQRKTLLFPPRVTGHHLLSAPRVLLWSSNLLPCYPWGINHV